ncbi:MAG: hypothetical protein ABFS14_12170 [Gemmatimonadota bacterium]
MRERNPAPGQTSTAARLTRRSLIVLAAMLAAGCGAPAVENDDVVQAETRDPADELLLASAKIGLPPEGLTQSDLPDPNGAGAAALQAYCTECHALPAPSAHSATDWPAVLRRMWLRMGPGEAAFAVPEPSEAERFVMIRYVMDNALEVSEMTLPDLAGRESFESTCSRCHELPDPRQHSPEDWAAVIRRMADHTQEILGEPLSRDQYEEITGYLRTITNP